MANNDKKFEDEELLDLLETKYPLTYREMGEKLSVSTEAVYQRVKKLIKDGKTTDRNQQRVRKNAAWYIKLMERNLQKSNDTGAGKVLLEMSKEYIPASRRDLNVTGDLTIKTIENYGEKEGDKNDKNDK